MQKDVRKPSATHLLAELAKLRTQQKYLEAIQVTLKPVSQSPSESNELDDFDYLKIEQDLNAIALENKLKHDIFNLRDLVKNFHSEMLNANGLTQFNTKQYREKIENIDQKQRELEIKNAEQLNRLKLEFCATENELRPLMNNLDLLQKSPSTKNTITAINMRRAQSAPIDKSDCDDLRKFDKFVMDHSGHAGGWAEEEHLFFLKMKNKHNNNIDEIIAAFNAFSICKKLYFNYFLKIQKAR